MGEAGTRAHYEIEESADATIIRLFDEIDLANASSLGDALFGVLQSGRSLVIDLTGLRHIDSVGMHVLLRASQRAGRLGTKAVLVAADLPLQLLEEIGLNRLVPIFPDASSALAALAAGSP
jgi:anti-anti-sigma factor